MIHQHGQIVPIEVKAGSSGHLKSLHLFMALKKLPLAIRINADVPTRVNIQTDTLIHARANYTLLSLPFYLIEQITRLLTHE